MLVNFVKNGVIIDTRDTNQAVAIMGYAGGPFTTPDIQPRLSGSNALLDGRLASGSMLGHVASAGQATLLWKTPSNATQQVWKMDSQAAAQTGIATIQAAITASTAVIDLYSNGTTGS